MMKRSRLNPRPKTLSSQGLLGQKGVNLIEKIVLDMGSRWTPSGPNEIGIDGYIELFDPGSRVALGKTLAVQSKAVSVFANETNETIDFKCERRDLEYWLHGNLPVLLIVSRPATGEAFWESVKDYFTNVEKRSSGTVTFRKSIRRFTVGSLNDLLDLGRSPEIGLYLAPVPRTEHLHSNLLPLLQFPSRLYVAATSFRLGREVWACFRQQDMIADGAWILRDRNILSFHDLSEAPWSLVCDQGTVESCDSSEWAESSDDDRTRQFVQLLNQTLRSQLSPNVRYWPNEDCYAYVGDLDEGKKRRSYPSLHRQSPLSVVSKFRKSISDGRVYEWLRHLGFRGQFRRLDSQWYLEITPTYRFTWDGNWLYRFHNEALKGIKRLEGNRAVLSTVLFWANYLNPQNDLFASKDQPLIFGSLLEFELEVGINDSHWSARDPNPPPDSGLNIDEAFLPFDKEPST
jgi:hypothetical protein